MYTLHMFILPQLPQESIKRPKIPFFRIFETFERHSSNSNAVTYVMLYLFWRAFFETFQKMYTLPILRRSVLSPEQFKCPKNQKITILPEFRVKMPENTPEGAIFCEIFYIF